MAKNNNKLKDIDCKAVFHGSEFTYINDSRK
jgi:hypothetical protein